MLCNLSPAWLSFSKAGARHPFNNNSIPPPSSPWQPPCCFVFLKIGPFPQGSGITGCFSLVAGSFHAVRHPLRCHRSGSPSFGCFYLFTLANRAGMSRDVQTALQDPASSSFQHIPRSGMAGSFGSSVSKFFEMPSDPEDFKINILSLPCSTPSADFLLLLE